MLIGFSTAACPEWDLHTLLSEGKTLGFNAVELHGLPGHPHLPACPTLADTDEVASAFQSAGIQLVSLVNNCTLSTFDRQARTQTQETLDLAARLRCPYVIIKTGTVSSGSNPDPTLADIVASLTTLTEYAAEKSVTILVENTGTFAASRHLWYILDAVRHPALRCCWNPCLAAAAGDSLSISVPRIGRQVSITHILDAIFDKQGNINRYVPLGHGQIEWRLYLRLMRGIGATPHLIVSAPTKGTETNSREYLATAQAWLDEQLKQLDLEPELSAYKGDKNAPKFASTKSRATANG